MSILDGNAYDNKCLETGQEREDDLDACALLLNNKVPILRSLHEGHGIAPGVRSMSSCCLPGRLLYGQRQLFHRHLRITDTAEDLLVPCQICTSSALAAFASRLLPVAPLKVQLALKHDLGRLQYWAGAPRRVLWSRHRRSQQIHGMLSNSMSTCVRAVFVQCPKMTLAVRAACALLGPCFEL